MAVNTRKYSDAPMALLLSPKETLDDVSQNRVSKTVDLSGMTTAQTEQKNLFQKKLYDDPYLDSRKTPMAADFECIHRELMTYFTVHPKALTQMNWRMFELLLDAVFFNQAYETVLGAGHHGNGIDIRLWRKKGIGEVLTLVQANKSSPDNPIQIDAVKSLAFEVATEKANTGLYITASRYSPSDKQFDDALHAQLIPADSTDATRWCRAFRK